VKQEKQQDVYKVGNESFKVGDITVEQMQRVGLDVMNGVPEDQRTEKYTPEMEEYRRYFDAWRKTLPPNAVVDFPALL
jgi:hypothetical protein